MLGNAVSEATGKEAKRAKNDVSDRDVVVLGSGNLGLIYLMEEPRRLTLEEIDERHPQLVAALRAHPHVGWLLVRSSEHGPVALGARGTQYLADGRIEGEDPLAHFSPTAPQHLPRTDGFAHVADIMVGSFYDPALDEGCAFEELICFHGGIGGFQTRAFILHPSRLECRPGPSSARPACTASSPAGGSSSRGVRAPSPRVASPGSDDDPAPGAGDRWVDGCNDSLRRPRWPTRTASSCSSGRIRAKPMREPTTTW